MQAIFISFLMSGLDIKVPFTHTHIHTPVAAPLPDTGANPVQFLIQGHFDTGMNREGTDPAIF